MHPLRVHILLSMAARRRLSPAEYQRSVGVSLKKAAYHFRALKAAEAITLQEKRQVRGATEHVYRLALGSMSVRALLAVVTRVLVHLGDEDQNDPELSWSGPGGVTIDNGYHLEVDEPGYRELEEILVLFLPRALKVIQARTGERLAHTRSQRVSKLAVVVKASENGQHI